MPCTLRNGVYQWKVCKQNDLWSLILQGHSAYTHWRLDGIQCLFLHHQWRFAFRNGEGGEGKSAGVFLSPNYITENIKGDVCVSDLFRRALIVTDKFNEERFSYGEKKRKHGFCQCRCNRHPWSHGCLRTYENTVYTLDSDGQLLRLFPQAEDLFFCSWGLYIDLENNLFGDIQDDSIISI